MLTICRLRFLPASVTRRLQPERDIKYYSTETTIIDSELKKFAEQANIWWNETGPMKGLHNLNRIRVPLLRDGLLNHLRVPMEKRSTDRPLKGLKIIDVGCGAGIYSEALARIGGDVTGLDAAADLIEVARNHMTRDASLSANLSYVNSTVEEYSSDFSNHFDAVVCSEVIEHIENKKLFVENCVKLTKKNGLLFFTTINQTWLAAFIAIHLMENVFKTITKGTHQYNLLLHPADLEKLLQSNNCDVQKAQGLTYSPGGKWELSNLKIWYAMQAVKV